MCWDGIAVCTALIISYDLFTLVTSQLVLFSTVICRTESDIRSHSEEELARQRDGDTDHPQQVVLGVTGCIKINVFEIFKPSFIFFSTVSKSNKHFNKVFSAY